MQVSAAQYFAGQFGREMLEALWKQYFKESDPEINLR
jgi:hypothetical protein